MANWNDRLRIVASLMAAVLLALGVTLAAESDSPLAEAAMKRDAAAVRALLAQRVDVNAPGNDGTPALHWAVRTDELEMARLLLGAGADPKQANRYGVTPLFLACANGNEAMIRLLLDAGADPNAADPTGETPLMEAARVGTLGAVKLLLERGAVLDARDPAFEQTALMVAVRENHPDVVAFLVERGADVNARTRTGATPAWILPNSVPGFGHGVGIVRGGLPARGLRNPIPGALFPLLYAARDGRLDIARTLVAAKADVNQVDANGITPLIAAITNNHVDVARFLIDHGADINASDWYGRTPLWAAVETRNMDVDNATFNNSIDRAAVPRADPGPARKRRRPERPDEGSPADQTAVPADDRFALVGGLHGPDAVPHGRARGRCHRDAPAARARRRSAHPDVRGNDGADGRRRHELGLRPDVR